MTKQRPYRDISVGEMRMIGPVGWVFVIIGAVEEVVVRFYVRKGKGKGQGVGIGTGTGGGEGHMDEDCRGGRGEKIGDKGK
jgi:hypothetical protein